MAGDLLARCPSETAIQSPENELPTCRHRIALNVRRMELTGQAQIVEALKRSKLWLGKHPTRRTIGYQTHRPGHVGAMDEKLEAPSALGK